LPEKGEGLSLWEWLRGPTVLRNKVEDMKDRKIRVQILGGGNRSTDFRNFQITIVKRGAIMGLKFIERKIKKFKMGEQKCLQTSKEKASNITYLITQGSLLCEEWRTPVIVMRDPKASGTN